MDKPHIIYPTDITEEVGIMNMGKQVTLGIHPGLQTGGLPGRYSPPCYRPQEPPRPRMNNGVSPNILIIFRCKLLNNSPKRMFWVHFNDQLYNGCNWFYDSGTIYHTSKSVFSMERGKSKTSLLTMVSWHFCLLQFASFLAKC